MEQQLLWIIGAMAVGALLFLLLGRALKKRLLTLAGETAVDELFLSLFKYGRGPLLCLALLVGLQALRPLAPLSEQPAATLDHAVSLLFIGLITWLIVRGIRVLSDYVAHRFDLAVKDNLRARRIHTQLALIRRLFVMIVLILAAATALMTFDRAQHAGQTILASAGIAGIVFGMAAQKTIGTFLAGLQIAFTQPIRLDDVVIVENEWGRIEEITLTYVVVNIWDQRRLVVPVTYFMEKPFQNWTRTTAELLGTIFFHADYTLPVEAVRNELKRLAEESPLWDRRVCVLQVTGATERTLELRALVSAADASSAWTLRCQIRESLIAFIQREHPASLPKVRAEFKDGVGTV